jgi:ketosteroid isomerase-like protein
MSARTPLQTVQEIYAAFGTGDVPAILERVAPDVDWLVHGPEGLPFTGRFDGHDGTVRFFSTVGQISQHSAFEPREFIADGDDVVAFGIERGTIRTTGKTFDSNWAHSFTVRDGRVTRFRLFTDTAQFVEAMQPDEATA